MLTSCGKKILFFGKNNKNYGVISSLRRMVVVVGRPKFNSNQHCLLTSSSTSTSLSQRSISSTRVVYDGEMAEKCNLNIIRSPYPAISEGPYDPLPDFVMQNWKKNYSNSDKDNDQQQHHRHDDNDGYLSKELAIYDGSTGMKRTFKQQYKSTKGIAGNLKYEMGVDEKSCVCLFAPNHVDYLPVTLAVGLMWC